MKNCVLIIDGAAGLPLPERGNKTCLELAYTPNLDAMVQEGILGLVRTIPPGMEPSSACGCISVLGYDPKVMVSEQRIKAASEMMHRIDDILSADDYQEKLSRFKPEIDRINMFPVSEKIQLELPVGLVRLNFLCAFWSWVTQRW